MSNQGKISLIICSRFGGIDLEECLDSILVSTYSNIEVIVVNNGSGNRDSRFLKSKYLRNKLVKVVDAGENRFFTGGNNFGAIKARGEKLIFLNDDTIVDPKFIANLVVFTGKNNKYLVQPKVIRYRDKRIDNAGGFYSLWGTGFGRGHGEADRGQYERPRPLSYVVGTVFMIDANFFWEINGFDEWFKYHYEDVDLSIRAIKNGGSCWYCPKAVVYHKGSLTVKKLKTSDLKLNIRKNRLMTILKNFNGVEKLFRLALCLFHSIGGVRPVFDKYVQDFVDRQRLQEVLRTTGSRHKTLLDVGCGDGNFVLMARKNGFDAWGTDKEPRVSNKHISAGTIENFKPGNKYDLITAFHVLEHLKNPLLSLSKLSGSLKNDGCLVFEVPLVGNWSERFLGKEYFAYFDRTHVNLWKKKKWLQLIKKAGLIIKRQGTTSYEFPLAVISGGFRKGFFWGIIGMILFLPFKLMSLSGRNEEIVRIYCIKAPKQ
ncbi:methyltransferase domain-containing protein [Candidatus Collierbacteria bacterium]|nr:methyltransferase domain-containing protein [Candidatus Collierbacteria bacterium]